MCALVLADRASRSATGRAECLEELRQILNTDAYREPPAAGQTLDLFPSTAAEEAKQTALEYGLVDVHAIVARSPRLQLVEELSERYRFLHWELEFADVFKERGGFDVVLGNPPWLPLRWSETDVLGDAEPIIAVRGESAVDVSAMRDALLERSDDIRTIFVATYCAIESTRAFFSAPQNFPLLGGGIRTNLYKCFLPIIWAAVNECGVAGVLHDEGIYDDPNGGRLRSAAYERLRCHFQHQNAFNLFPIAHRERFSINIYGQSRSKPTFDHIANLFHPSTIDRCYEQSSTGTIPSIKTEDNDWEIRGHPLRVIPVDENTLRVFAEVFDEQGTPSSNARLAAVHSRPILDALSHFAAARERLDDICDWTPSAFWHETHAQRDGLIERKTAFSVNPESFVMCGPHFFNALPLYKTPRRICSEKGHYDVIDLDAISDDYLPRTIFAPTLKARGRTPSVDFGEKRSVVEYFRIATSEAIGPDGERTLQAAIIPSGIAHIHKVYSYAFEDPKELLRVAGGWMSLPIDFLVKATGAGSFLPNLARRLPVVSLRYYTPLAARALLLNALTSHYAKLWRNAWDDIFKADSWSRQDLRLPLDRFSRLSPEWSRDFPLRSYFERRQALVEIDVIVAKSLGFSLSQLNTIYRTQFSVLRSYESDTWYDRRGRIVFTNSKGLVGVGLPRAAKKGDFTPAWEDIKAMQSGSVSHTIIDDTQPGGPLERTIVYEAPFDRCDRERDYEVAWAHFEKRFEDRT